MGVRVPSGNPSARSGASPARGGSAGGEAVELGQGDVDLGGGSGEGAEDDNARARAAIQRRRTTKRPQRSHRADPVWTSMDASSARPVQPRADAAQHRG